MTQRPTTLRLLAETCPHALDLYDQGAPYDRRLFAVGTAAHEVLDALTVPQRFDGDRPLPPAPADPAWVAEVANRVAARLVITGRTGPDSDPPMLPDDVFAGRDLALRYVEFTGQPEGHTETPLAFRQDWSSCDPDDPGVWFRLRLDNLRVVEFEDEEFGGIGLEVRDYKSSWRDGEATLDSVQIRGQAVAAWLTWPRWMAVKPDFIRRTVANLRTGTHHSTDLWLDADGEATLRQWQADIALCVEAAETRPRIARPGIGCIGCQYAMTCGHAAEVANAMALPDLGRETIAAGYAAALGRAKAWEEAARLAADQDAVAIEGGRVGFVAKASREANDDAGVQAWERWRGDAEVDPAAEGLVRGFVSAFRFGVSQLETIAKTVIGKGRAHKADREAWLSTLLTTKVQSRFGVHPDRPDPTNSPTE